jgi:type IV pilus assembly protein PilM
MNLLPQASGTRPRVACEISPQGVVAARSADATSPLAAVARVELAEGAVVPGLRPGNVVDRVAVAAAVRKALEAVDAKPNSRLADITLVIPDSAVRVLLLDFDALSGKQSEVLPIVRFRLKKLLPFDSDDAMVSYQVMSTSKNLVRVLAVAIPRDVLSEYETAIREAGFEPGSVLPSTLAALAAIDSDDPALLVNANAVGVTTAIVQKGILMLHRSVDLQEHDFEGLPLGGVNAVVPMLPLVDVLDSQEEWAAQEALPEHPRIEEELSALAATDLQKVPLSSEIAQAVSVAAAYFEDTLAMSPSSVLSAGPLSAEKLGRILREEGVGPDDGLFVRELVESSALLSEAVTAAVPRAWLSSVTGALRA